MSDKLIHYSLLHDIDKAVDYLFQYLLEQKPICIVADYDVDGATSCSIMTKGLRMLGNGKENKTILFLIGLNMDMDCNQVLLMICWLNILILN